MAWPMRTRRFTTAEYERMGEAGIFGPDERVELIRGEIVGMRANGGPHFHCVTRLNRLLSHTAHPPDRRRLSDRDAERARRARRIGGTPRALPPCGRDPRPAEGAGRRIEARRAAAQGGLIDFGLRVTH